MGGCGYGVRCAGRARSSIGGRAHTHVRMSVPQRSDWARMRSMSSGPRMPSGKPGKFSTSVVVVSCPPAATPPAMRPSSISGRMLARAA